MIRHIPPFILQNHEQNAYSGSFKGFALLFDIADFTKIGTSLQKQGKKGAEELSRFLEEVFQAPISACERNGGFVSVFAGDAVCVLFPGGKPQNVLRAVVDIRDHFRDHNRFETAFGSFDVKVRLTIVTGEIRWKIFINDTQNEYVFFGETIREMAELSGMKVDVIFSDDAGKALGEEHLERLTTGYRLMDNPVEINCKPRPLSYEYSPKTIESFVRASIRNESPTSEIRSAAYCFANLEGVPADRRENAIAAIARFANTYGGFVNKLDATDKGLIAILLFGLPKTEGKTLERICSFSLEVTAQVSGIALGISCGSVFAGYTGNGDTKEYTALGHPINLAARLMSKAKAGEVLTDHYLQKELRKTFDFESIGEINLKGISFPIQHFRLLARTTQKHTQYASEFVGRETESAQIKVLIDRNHKEKSNLACYVVGDAGVGKSRLIGEIMHAFENDDFHVFHLHCDAILQKSLEVIRQLLRRYFHFDPTIGKSRGIESFRSQWASLADDDAELERIESIVASMLGYEWEDSVWSVLPSNEKPVQLKNAFSRFMQKIAGQKPVLIHLDDPQWIDDSSKEYLQHVGEKRIAPIVLLCACRYTEDGKIPDLDIPNHASETIALSSLDIAGSRNLIASILGLNTVPEATVEAIDRKASGNPFFIEQLVAWLQENDRFDASGGLTQAIDMSVTFSISDVIGSRVDRLAEAVRECVYHASVLGMEFDVQVLSKMLNREAQPALDDGMRNRIWNILNEIRYIFSHILIRDIVYQRMMSERLRELHKIAAEAMGTVYKDNEDALNEYAEEIAGHYLACGNEIKAADFYHRSGTWHGDNYRLKLGEAILTKAAEIRERILGEDHPATADSKSNLAVLCEKQGKFTKAESLHLRSLAIREKVLGLEHPDTASAYNNLAAQFEKQGRFLEGTSMHLKALAIRESKLGPEHPLTADSLNNLAIIYTDQGIFDKAEPLHLRSLAIREKVLGAGHPATASSYNNLAILYLNQGRYEEAESLYKKALSMRKDISASGHPDIADTLNNLAVLYYNQNKLEEAEPLYLQGMEIRMAILGQEHPLVADSLNNLASLYNDQGNYKDAEALHLQALSIREKVLGPEHPDTASSINNLALLNENLGNFGEAERLHIKARTIKEKVLGPEHPDTAFSLFNLALLYKDQRRYEEAEPLLLRAMTILIKTLGARHPDTIATIEVIVSLYEQTGNEGKVSHYRAMLVQRNDGQNDT